MAKKAKKAKKKASGNARSGGESRFERVVGTKLPPALEKMCQPLIYIGAAFLTAALVQAIMPSLRSLSPFAAILGVLILCFGYLKKREMVLGGYDEYLFKTLDYTYLTRYGKTPTGVLLIKTDEENGARDLYHIAVTGKDNVPPLDWIIRVYVPKNAMLSEYNGRKHFSSVYGYQVEEEA